MNLKTTLLVVIFLIQSLMTSSQNEWACLSTGIYVKAIAEDANNLWIGNLTGVVRINKVTQERTFYNKTNSPIPCEIVNDIVVEPSGVVWIATGNSWIDNSGGLARFDGINWQIFTADSSPLPSNCIQTLALSSTGILWIGMYDGGLASYDGTSWQVYNKTNSQLPSNKVTALTYDSNGTLWIATEQGLAKIDDDSWTAYPSSNNFHFSALTSLSAAADGHIWIGSMNGVIDFNGWTSTKYDITNSAIPQNSINTIFADSQGTVWIGCNMNGLCTFDGTTWNTYTTSNSQLPGNSINRIFKRSTGTLLIGNSGSLTEFDRLNWTQINTSATPIPGLEIFDVEGNGNNNDKWIAASNGVAQFDGTNWTVYDKTNSGLRSPITSIKHDGSGTVWMASSKSGLFKLQGHEWRIYSTIMIDIPVLELTSLDIDKSGTLWIGTETLGLIKWKSPFDWITYSTSNSGMPHNYVESIICDDENNVFVATKGGLAKFSNSDWTVYNEASGLPENIVTDIALDENNILWIAMDGGGLAKLENGGLTVFDLYAAGMPSSYLTSVTTDNDGNVWMGTWNDGLIKFDGNAFTSYTSLNSMLSHDYINTLYTDNHNNLWIGTKWGISLFNKNGVILSKDEGIVATKGPLYGSCFPNPANESFKIKLSTGNSLEGYMITNLTGQTIRPFIETSQTLIDVKSLPKGIYLIKIKSHSGDMVEKFIKQ